MCGAGIPEPTVRRGRFDEEVAIAALLLRYGVTNDSVEAAEQAAGKTLSGKTAATVESKLEALHFLGWGTEGVTPTVIHCVGATLPARTAFCQAHGFVSQAPLVSQRADMITPHRVTLHFVLPKPPNTCRHCRMVHCHSKQLGSPLRDTLCILEL